MVVWELRQKEPVVDFRMLQNRNFMLSTATMFLLGFVLYGSTMLLPVFLQTLLGYTAMRSGLVLSPGGMVIAVTMPLVGFLLSKIEARWLVIFGLVVSSFGLFHMAGFDLDIDYHTAMMARVLQSAGLAFLFVPINTMAFATVPREKMGGATGLINLARNIGGSSGIAIVTTILARRTQFHQARLVSHMTPYDPAYTQALAGMTHARRSPAGPRDDVRHDAAAIVDAGIRGQLLGAGNHLPVGDSADVLCEEGRPAQRSHHYGVGRRIRARFFPLQPTHRAI